MTANPFSPKADPRDALDFCAAAIRRDQWFSNVGMAEHWPLTTDEVATLMHDAGEYDIDAEQLHDLIDRGIVARPGSGEAGFEWDAQDLCRAVGVLEARGQWLPTPCSHDPKKHSARLVVELARKAGELASVAHSGPTRFDLRQLIVLLTLHDNREARMKIAALLEAVLEVDHDVQL